MKREDGNELPRDPRYWKMPAESRISRESRVLRMDSGDVFGGRERGWSSEALFYGWLCDAEIRCEETTMPRVKQHVLAKPDS